MCKRESDTLTWTRKGAYCRWQNNVWRHTLCLLRNKPTRWHTAESVHRRCSHKLHSHRRMQPLRRASAASDVTPLDAGFHIAYSGSMAGLTGDWVSERRHFTASHGFSADGLRRHFRGRVRLAVDWTGHWSVERHVLSHPSAALLV